MVDVFQEMMDYSREQLLFSLVGDGLLSPGVAAARANMSEDEFRARMERDRQTGSTPDAETGHGEPQA